MPLPGVPVGQVYSTETIAGRLVKVSHPIYPWCLRATAPRKASLEYELFRLCERTGYPIERLFAHYGESTALASTLPHTVAQEHWGRASSIGAVVAINAAPLVVDTSLAWYSSLPETSPSGLVFPVGVAPPSSEDELASSYTYGLYIGAPEPFYEMTIMLWSGGSGRIFGPLIAIPVDVSADGTITRWRYATITQDSTGGLSASGSMKFHTGAYTWRRGQIVQHWNDGAVVSSESPLYWIRILASFSTASPRLKGLRLPSWIVLIRTGDLFICTNLGWRYENDLDGDGYLSDQEFQSRPYPQAAARRVYYARVGTPINLNQARQTYPGWFLVRIWDEQVRELMVEATCRWLDQPNGYRAVSYMEASTPPGGSGMPVSSGGSLCDGPVSSTIQSSQFKEALKDAAETFHAQVKRNLPGKSWCFLHRSAPERPFVDGFTFRIRDKADGQIVRGILPEYAGLFGTVGVCRDWDYQAVAAQGGRTVFVGDCYLPFVAGHTVNNWQRSLVTVYAQYLLRHIEGHTSICFYPANVNLQGNHVTTAGVDYYRSGVPYSMAYLPRQLMAVSIGVPDSIPAGYSPIPLVIQSEGGWSSSSVIGDSTDTQVTVTVNGDAVQVELVPTNVFVLYPQTGWSGMETDIVLARAFTNGLVLYRCKPMTAAMDDSSYLQSTLQMNLPGTFRVLGFDGTPGTAVTSVSLYGWQGLILLRG